MKSSVNRFYHRAKRWLIDGLILQGHRKRFPDKLVIETTNICSLQCSCCPNGQQVERRPGGRMSREVFDQVMANLDIPVKLCFLHMCGEPFLNPDLEYFCLRLRERKIIPTIFSNGYNINLALLDKILAIKGIRISFSMELHSREAYEQIRRPGNFDRAMDSLTEIDRHFADAGRVYGLNVILEGEYDSGRVEQIVRDLFAKFSRLNNITFSSQWPWPELPQTGNLAGHLSAHNSYCSQAKGLPAILCDGTATFCNLDYCGKMIVGDMKRQKLSSIVNNRASRTFRKNLAMRRLPAGSFCENCVLPRYNSFTLDITRAKMKKASEGDNPELFKSVDDYFRNTITGFPR